MCAGVFGLAAYVGLILVPAWSAYSRFWERLAATVLSLYVLVALLGIGVPGPCWSSISGARCVSRLR